MNAANGFLVTILEWVVLAASATPFATVPTPAVTLPLIAVFYAGCVPTAIAGGVASKGCASPWGALLVLWAALWLALVGLGSE